MPGYKFSTKPWYCEYQALVLPIPSAGTTNTKPWYCEYQALVLRVPKALYFLGTAFVRQLD